MHRGIRSEGSGSVVSLCRCAVSTGSHLKMRIEANSTVQADGDPRPNGFGIIQMAGCLQMRPFAGPWLMSCIPLGTNKKFISKENLITGINCLFLFHFSLGLGIRSAL